MARSLLSTLLPSSWVELAGLVVLLTVSYNLWGLLYNLYLHPLRKFPGPAAARASLWTSVYHSVQGNGPFWETSLHQKYGDVVRVAPNELSFWSADSFKDIYGHKAGGDGIHAMTKDPRFYKDPPGQAPAITSAKYEDHSRMRRVFSNAFSDRALKLQEPLFLTYVDQLIAKLRKSVSQDPERKWNLVSLLNFTTFDVMGDLTFGEPLGMLDGDDYHPWVSMIFSGVKFGIVLQTIRYFPWLEHVLLKYCIPPSAKKGIQVHRSFSRERVDRRMERKDARPDIWGLVMKREKDSGLSREEMYANASIFMLAGTETTATGLSGLTFHLLKNPATMKRLVKEVRDTFPSEADITMEKLQAMKYLHACLEEGLRMYPPVPTGLPRVTPAIGPVMVDGKEIPPNASVKSTHFAVYRNPENFHNPYEFAPDRWLSSESSVYANDKKHAFQPFSLGPRGCLGKNMAYHEMRLILVKILYNFDLSLCEESNAWADHKIFLLWEKPPLMVRFAERAS